MLSKRLKELRRKKGLTMKKAGALAGVTESSISLYESGKRYPSCSVLIELAKLYETDVDTLLEGEFK